ncbi:hypothetical protein F5X97DRAFT_345210 [Nemania serpens]|nr:hypothetical protein F5X97DRAFT_345210 [Nemania serpens]
MSDNSLQDDKKSLLSRSTDSAEVEGYTYELRDRRNYKNRYWHALHLLILYMLVIGTSTALVVMSYKVKDPTLAVYSPAESAVSYKTTILTYTDYAGPPTAERNKMWNDLHRRGVVTRISREEARKDTIRQTLYTQDFPGFSPYDSNGNPKEEVFEHLDHCVDRILQGIMCASNTAPSMWHKKTGSPHEGAPVEEWLKLSHHHTLATCRNFEEIQQWAFEREQKGWELRDEGSGIKMIT